jgi:hypothetical protein
MAEILISCLISSITLLTFGSFFCNIFLKQNTFSDEKFAENSIFGVIFLSFLALIVNFILPINKYIGNLVFLITLILFIKYFIKIKDRKKLFLFLTYSSLFTFFLILLSNVNRPDAGLYHLPYISLINENKVILGSANIHFRFGHISIIQYLSGIYNNSIFPTSSITIPLASIVSIFIIYLVKKFNLFFEKQNNFSFIIFLILIFVLTNFNRYSSYGNDAPSHIFFLFLAILFLDIKNFREFDLVSFYKIAFVSIFLFTLKVFMTAVLIIPLILFLISNKKKELLINKNLIICFVFIVSWMLKNILVSGCLVYPIQTTCIKSLSYYDADKIKEITYSSEAWAKGWSDQKAPILEYKEFNKNFNWFKTWKSNHLKKIFEKMLPFFILLFVTLFYLLLRVLLKKKKYIKIENINSSKISILLYFSLFVLLLWFLKFPIYRYGSSFISLSLILIITLVLRNYLHFINREYFTTIIVIGIVAFFLKNGLRIVDKYQTSYFDYPWPQIYSLDFKDKNNPKKFNLIKNKDQGIYYFSNQELCMYSKSPCSNYNLKNLDKKKIYGYDLFWIEKNNY